MPLRPLAEVDLPLVLAWRNAPEVRRNMYSQHEITHGEHLAWFGRLQHDPQSRWFIHVDTKGRPDGVVYFTQYQAIMGNAFWGFYSAPKSSPGTGTRLGLDAIDKALLEMKLHKLNAEVIGTNVISLRFHLKLGFQQEGLLRDYHFDGKKYVDVVRLGILDTEWAAKREEIQARTAKYDSTTHSASAE